MLTTLLIYYIVNTKTWYYDKTNSENIHKQFKCLSSFMLNETSCSLTMKHSSGIQIIRKNIHYFFARKNVCVNTINIV